MWPYVPLAVAITVSRVVDYLKFKEALRGTKPTERPKILRELKLRVSISRRKQLPED